MPLADEGSLDRPCPWPEAAEVARRFASSADPQADAARFVRESVMASRVLLKEAFVAFEVHRVWEYDGLTEAEGFRRYFRRGRRTLYRWKRETGLCDEARSRAIASGIARRCPPSFGGKSDTVSLPGEKSSGFRGRGGALPSRADWRVADQMDLPFAAGYDPGPLQAAGEAVLDAVDRLESMPDGARRAVADMLERVADVAASARDAAVERCEGVDVAA